MAEAPADSLSQPDGLRAIPRGIWALGLVSLFMDMSSELVHSLLPVFVVSVLGASPLTLGLIEGVAEATASISKVFSGLLSDYLGKRKLLAVIGYGMAALTKPLFPLASSVELVIVARFIDRIGKGIRGAPRDALVADIAPPHLRGACYGLRQSLDTVGAFVGPLLAVVLMAAFANDIRLVFWVAVIPAMLAVLLLVVGVEEPSRPRATSRVRAPLRSADLSRLGVAYWWVVLIGAVLTLARFSEAFLVLRAEDVGLRIALVPLVMVVMSVFYALSSYPAGVLADRTDRRTLLASGFVVLILADVALASAGGVGMVMIGAALWGLHMGLTQGLLATLVADASPPELRGSAFGLFNLVSGLVLLVASVIAGALWHGFGAPATFLTGAMFTILALVGLFLRPPRNEAGLPSRRSTLR
jgi:MFS family permease